MAKEYTKDTKKRFWDIIKKPKPVETDLTVSAVDTIAGTITVTSNSSCPPNQMYIIPANSGVNSQILTNNGGVLTWTGVPPQTITYPYSMYTLTENGETLQLSHEEWNTAQKAAFDFIKKKRQYRDDFENLIGEEK